MTLTSTEIDESMQLWQQKIDIADKKAHRMFVTALSILLIANILAIALIFYLNNLQ